MKLISSVLLRINLLYNVYNCFQHNVLLYTDFIFSVAIPTVSLTMLSKQSPISVRNDTFVYNLGEIVVGRHQIVISTHI